MDYGYYVMTFVYEPVSVVFVLQTSNLTSSGLVSVLFMYYLNKHTFTI